MSIHASCGHPIPGVWSQDERSHLVVAVHNAEGLRALSHEVRCTRCRREVLQEGRLLTSPAEEAAWLAEGALPGLGVMGSPGTTGKEREP